MQYCSLQHWTLLLSPVTSALFLLWLHPFILSGGISPLISSSTLGTYWPGEFVFQYLIILPFHTVCGVLKARILKWFAIPFSSGPHSVRPLHHDPPILGGPTWHGLVSSSYTRLWSVWLDWLVFCDYGFSVSALWCPLAIPTILLGSHVQEAVAAQVQEGGEELLQVQGQEGRPVRRQPSSKVKSSSCALLEQLWRDNPCSR